MLPQPDGFVDPDQSRQSLPLKECSIWIKKSSKSLDLLDPPIPNEVIFISIGQNTFEILKKMVWIKDKALVLQCAADVFCERYQSKTGLKNTSKRLKDLSILKVQFTWDFGIRRVLDLTNSFSDGDHAQDCTAMLSAEAKYVALSTSCAQHSRTKHIHTRYHFIKEQVENGIIELYFVRTEYQLADMFTKALPEERFQYLVRRIGMRCLTPAELEVLTKESA
ncbi:hypothetical protein Tco_0083894 [Tanacetum coccineum]